MTYVDNDTGARATSSRRLILALMGALALSSLVLSGCSGGDEAAEQAELERRQAAEAAVAAQRVADSIQQVNDSIAAVELAVAESLAAAEAEEAPPHESLSTEWGTFTVQIGSYDSRELATPFFNELVGEGLDPYIIDEVAYVGGDERIVYRLRFGKYSSKDEAHNRGSEVALRHRLDYWVDNYRH
ncbi:MAG: SPOR domain-containing protein [Candidatus Zixiibacteriota bacterium]